MPSRIGWDSQKELDRGYSVLAAIIDMCSKEARVGNMSEEKVWRVQVVSGRATDVNFRELTAVERAGLSADAEERVGIVPAQALGDLRRVTGASQS